MITALAAHAAGLDNRDRNPRLKQLVNRLLTDLMVAIDELDISMDEFWTGVAYLTQAGKHNEFGLIVPGVVVEHFLDLRLDEAERRAGLSGGTVRTIEGPLYVVGAPLSRGEARDDGADEGEVLFMEGQVRNVLSKPVAGAVLDVWHANTMGNYSHFDPTQSAYNLRQRIETDKDGQYRFRSIMPSGYACPPGSQTEKLRRRWAVITTGRRTFTSSSRPPATGSSRPRSISTVTSTSTTILPSAPVNANRPRNPISSVAIP